MRKIEMEQTQDLVLADADLAALKKQGKVREVAKGDALWEVGDRPDTVWHVQKGKANMVIGNAEGREAIVHYCGRAQTFCIAAAISGKPMPCMAVAATDMTLVAMPRSGFLDLFKRIPAFARALMEQMAGQVCQSHQVSALIASPVRGRLAELLTRLNRDYAGEELPFTRQELANMSGTTVESAIRALSDWEKEGVIHTTRGNISVRQPEALVGAAA